MMRIGMNVTCGSFLCTYTTKKTLFVYTQQLSRPKRFLKSVVV